MAQEKKKGKKISTRLFHLVQYEKNPVTGKDLGFDESNIIKAVSHKTITWWAYILHDHDTYTKEEAEDKNEKYNMELKEGDPIPRHWHVVGKLKRNTELKTIARWFDLSGKESLFELPKGGKMAWRNSLSYLTHESPLQRTQGKYLYEDECIKANFDFREELNNLKSEYEHYGDNYLEPKERMCWDVLYDGKTLKECEIENPLLYMKYRKLLQENRLEYIKHQPAPPVRLNYFVEGKSGDGKGQLTRGLACALFPNIKDEEDIYFEVGAKGSTFEGYDGQPVIIWNEMRAAEMIIRFGGRANVFNILDPYPPTAQGRQNVKYGSIRLVNAVNIINGIETYKAFLDGLAGEYTDRDEIKHVAEDKIQAYRRMPFIIRIQEKDLAFFVNRGFADNDNRGFYQYELCEKIRANIKTMSEKSSGNIEAKKEVETVIYEPIVEKHNEIKEDKTKQRPTDEIVHELIDIEHYGERLPISDEERFLNAEEEDFIEVDGPTPFDEQEVTEEQRTLLIKMHGEERAQSIIDKGECPPLEKLKREYRELEKQGLLECQLKQQSLF